MRERWPPSGSPGSRPRPSTPPPSASSATSGRGCPRPAARGARLQGPAAGPAPAQPPGGYKFTAVKDLADELEWAKARRLDPSSYQATVEAMGRTPPIPGDLFAGLFRRYERAKERAGPDRLRGHAGPHAGGVRAREDVAEEFRGQYRWFSVDEYQDTNPLQQALLEAWLGERRDLAVVGDEDQTIYTFTGATSEYLTGFSAGSPRPGWSGWRTTTAPAPRSWPWPTGSWPPPRPRPGPGQAAGRDPALGPEPTVAAFENAEREVRAVVAEVARLAGPGSTWTRWPSWSGPTPRSPLRGGPGRRRHPLPGPGRAVLPPHRGAAGHRGAALALGPGGRRRPGRRPGGDLVRAVRVPPRRGARRRGGPPAPRQPGHPARHRRAPGGPAGGSGAEEEAADAVAGMALFLEEVGRRAAQEAEGTGAGSTCSPTTGPRGWSSTPCCCRRSRRGCCRSARRASPPRWPRSDGCSTWG
jgi:hypothetical protein